MHYGPHQILTLSRGLAGVSIANFVLGLVLLTGPGTASAHGAGYRLLSVNTIALEFFYSTGEPMAYQEARVYSPRDEKASFQSGRSDEFGRVSFVPDTPGDWRVVVKDEEGHLAEASVNVTDEFVGGSGDADLEPAAGQSIPMGGELFVRALLGVSVLFNAAAIARKCI
jgi:nickel transport protein